MELVAPGSRLMFCQIGSAPVTSAYLGLMIYALVGVIRSEFRAPQMKLVWVVLILCFRFFGALIYLFPVKRIEITPEGSIQSSNKHALILKE